MPYDSIAFHTFPLMPGDARPIFRPVRKVLKLVALPSYFAGKDNGLGDPMIFLTIPFVLGISGEVDFIAKASKIMSVTRFSIAGDPG